MRVDANGNASKLFLTAVLSQTIMSIGLESDFGADILFFAGSLTNPEIFSQ
jgi:hypothetical protein